MRALSVLQVKWALKASTLTIIYLDSIDAVHVDGSLALKSPMRVIIPRHRTAKHDIPGSYSISAGHASSHLKKHKHHYPML